MSQQSNPQGKQWEVELVFGPDDLGHTRAFLVLSDGEVTHCLPAEGRGSATKLLRIPERPEVAIQYTLRLYRAVFEGRNYDYHHLESVDEPRHNSSPRARCAHDRWLGRERDRLAREKQAEIESLREFLTSERLLAVVRTWSGTDFNKIRGEQETSDELCRRILTAAEADLGRQRHIHIWTDGIREMICTHLLSAIGKIREERKRAWERSGSTTTSLAR